MNKTGFKKDDLMGHVGNLCSRLEIACGKAHGKGQIETYLALKLALDELVNISNRIQRLGYGSRQMLSAYQMIDLATDLVEEIIAKLG